MKHVFTILLFWATQSLSIAQTSEGADACQEAKVRYFGKLFQNARARQASVTDYASGLAFPGDANIDITYYGLSLRLTHTPAYLNGVATITLKAVTANLNRFYLDLQPQHRVDSVKTGRGTTGNPLSFVRETNRLQIALPQALSLGQSLTVTVFYQGNPASLNGFGSFSFATHGPSAAPVIWTLSEPYGASDWFPCKDTPADKADSSAVDITADKQFVSVSNGRLLGIRENEDGTRTYRWRNSYPIAQYLISLAMTNYDQYETPFTYNGQTMPVTHYLYPETLPTVRANLDITPNMLRIFSDLFGPYPFLREKYGHAQFGWGGGMEHQTVSSMGGWNASLIAHELAHQWFGDKITCRDWNNIWLNEGFASYAEALYAQATTGATGYNTAMNTFLSRAQSAVGTLYVQDISNVNNIFNSNRTYSKGATVLHMLRGVLGDDLFFRSIRAYAAAPNVAYGTAVTEDFQAIVEQTAGRKLDYFFKQWIYGERFPTYRVNWQDNSGSGKPGVQVRLQQTTNTTNPGSFTMPVQMRVQSAAGDTLVTVFNDSADQTFTLPAKGQPTGVVLDPNNWILKNVASTTMTVTGTEEPIDNTLVVFPNPASDVVTVKFRLSKPGRVAVELVNTLGQIVTSLHFIALQADEIALKVPLTDAKPGRYTLRLETPNGKQSTGVIIR
jgi:aminopeptidase N